MSTATQIDFGPYTKVPPRRSGYWWVIFPQALPIAQNATDARFSGVMEEASSWAEPLLVEIIFRVGRMKAVAVEPQSGGYLLNEWRSISEGFFVRWAPCEPPKIS